MEAMMRHTIIALLIAAIAVISTSAFATPASYYDDAWANFIEKNAGKTTPDGFPLGQGAISVMRENEVWPEPFLKLVAPTDMSKVEAIALSQQAISNDRIYASENMASFLAASAEKLKKLTKQKDIKLPVYMLAYKADEIPTPTNSDLLEVMLGLYLTGEAGPVPATDVATDGNTVFPHHTKPLSGSAYRLYARNVQSQYSSLLKMTTQQAGQTLYEAFNQVAQSEPTPKTSPQPLQVPSQSDQSSSSSAQSSDRRANHKAILEKYRDQIKELRTQIWESDDPDERVRLTKKLHQLEDEREKELYADLPPRSAERMAQRQAIYKPYDEKIRALELEQAALERDPDSRDERKELQEKIAALRKERREAYQPPAMTGHTDSTHMNNERMTAAQRRARYDASKKAAQEDAPDDDAWLEEMGDSESIDTNQIDIATTWLMFEAMLTQTKATVTRIKLPVSLRTKLLIHAESAKRPAKVVEKFKTLALISSGEAISVQLACSIRDRFLGCPIKGDDATEAKVNKIAQAIINNAKSASKSDQLRAMQLVVNAKPQKVKNTIDFRTISEARYRDADFSLPFADEPLKVNTYTSQASETVAAYKRIVNGNNDNDKIEKHEKRGNSNKRARSYKKSKRPPRKPNSNNRKRYSNGSGSLALPF